MVKIDGLPIPKGRLVKGPKVNQYVGTVSDLLFNYCNRNQRMVGWLPMMQLANGLVE